MSVDNKIVPRRADVEGLSPVGLGSNFTKGIVRKITGKKEFEPLGVSATKDVASAAGFQVKTDTPEQAAARSKFSKRVH